MMTKRLVCTAIDDNYLWPWMVMTYSAMRSSGNVSFKLVLANVNGSITQVHLRSILYFCELLSIELEVLEIRSDLEIKYSHNKSLVCYAPLFLMDLMNQDFVWLDADLILLPGWTEIFESKISDNGGNFILAAAVDSSATASGLREKGNQAFDLAGDMYFNSGVMQMCPDNWRKCVTTEEWQGVAALRSELGFIYNDQDVLNFLTFGKNAILPTTFNHIVGDVENSMTQISIRHFAGYPKPWNLSPEWKEFFLTIQGANYFRNQESIRGSQNAFIEYPLYWNLEAELIEFLRETDQEFYKTIQDFRSKNLQNLGLRAQIKLSIIKFFAKKFG